MEEYTNEEQETTQTEVKRWFQDNLRIIVSIVIVVLIAGGIYSYSKRTEAPLVADETVSTEEQDELMENPVDISSSTTEESAKKEEATTEKEISKKEDSKATPAPTKQEAPASQETGASFVETAAKGDSATTMARRALANYLEKNPDSALTKEHKIYIEDYLRKNVQPGKRVGVGTSMEFSKDLVKKAIDQSKGLNEQQLKNLQKYSARVASL